SRCPSISSRAPYTTLFRSPLVLLSTTLATTPSPRMINSMVPSTSARNGGIGLDEEGAKLSARRRLVYTVQTSRRRADSLAPSSRSEEHTSELQSPDHLV